MFNDIHKIIILWGPLPLGFKVQVSNFKMKSHELGVLHIPPLKINTILGVTIQLLEFILQIKWIFFHHFNFSFPGSFFSSKVLPLHLYSCYHSTSQFNFFPVQYLKQFWQKLPLWFHLYNIPINYVRSIMHISF